MTWWSRRVSPVRIMLCAVFMGAAFVLASWTSARADDKGVLQVVSGSEPTVGQVVEKVTGAVVSTSADVAAGDLEPTVAETAEKVDTVVTEPVAVVDEAVTKPVRDVVAKPVGVVDERVADVVVKTSKALSDSTLRVIEDVKVLAPVAGPVVDAVVEVVVPTPMEAPAPLPDLVEGIVDGGGVSGPGESDPMAQPPLGGSAAPATSTPAGASPFVVDPLPSAATLVAGHASASAAGLFGATAGALPEEGRPSGAPVWPLVVHGGAGSSPGSAGASTSGGSDAGLTPAWFETPRFITLAMASEQACPAPGPCADPGSRPG